MDFPSLDQLLDDETPLLTLPAIVADLIAMLDDPDADLEGLARLLSSDAVLTARVLRIVNSAWYALPMPVSSIRHALSLLGMKELRALVIATRVADTFRGLPDSLIDMRRFWVNTYTSASIAREVALGLKLEEERLFTATLLHHLGIMVMLQRMPVQMARLMLQAEANEQELYRQEQAELGYTHATVAASLMRRWQLPAFFAEVCEYHHEFYRAPSHRTEAAVIHLADTIAQGLCPLMNIDSRQSQTDLAVFNYLPLQGDTLTTLAEQARDEQDRALMLFQ